MPKIEATVMDRIDTDISSLKDKVVQLAKDLAEVESKKKASNEVFNSEIKDLKEMIKMTLEQIKSKEKEKDEQ